MDARAVRAVIDAVDRKHDRFGDTWINLVGSCVRVEDSRDGEHHIHIVLQTVAEIKGLAAESTSPQRKVAHWRESSGSHHSYQQHQPTHLTGSSFGDGIEEPSGGRQSCRLENNREQNFLASHPDMLPGNKGCAFLIGLGMLLCSAFGLKTRHQSVAVFHPPSVAAAPVHNVLRMRGGEDLVKCRFEIKVEHAEPDDKILLVWAHSKARRRCAYQDWDKPSGVQLRQDDNRIWWAEVALPVGDMIEFKFATRSSTGNLKWEEVENRQIVIPDGNIVLEFVFGNSSTPEPHVKSKPTGLGLLVDMLAHASARLPAFLASIPDAVALASQRCDESLVLLKRRTLQNPALLAHVPLAVMLLADMLTPPWRRSMHRVRDGVYVHQSVVEQKSRSQEYLKGSNRVGRAMTLIEP